MAAVKVLGAALVLVALMSDVMSYKILVMITMPSRSHFNLGKGVADILHERGHQVTLVNAYGSNKLPYREIGVPELLEEKDKHSGMGFDMEKGSKLGLLMQLNTMLPAMTKATFGSEKVKKLLADKSEKFDLIVIEYFLNEAMYALGLKYDCPVVVLSPVTMMHFLARATGNPISPASIPNVFLSYTGEMSLMERVANTFMAIALELMERFMLDPSQNAIYQEFFPEEAARVPYLELKKRVALVLSNSHPSLGLPRPLLPNAVEIGGYHIGEVKPLPEDLQKLLDGAKNGVIFFSMGSNLKSSQLPEDKKNDILKSLGKLKETVLWKFETDLPNKPANVIIRSWLPQTSVLAHPNVKLFISHGGYLSCTEAASAGVPLLAIPIFGDQQFNAKATQARGNGLMLSYPNLTETSLTWALRELTTNSKYTENAKSLYRNFNDRPMSPRDLVAFYAEHVVRTKGAPHLSPPPLSLCSAMLLDVTLVIAIPLLAIASISCFLCKKLCCKGKKARKVTASKKNK